MTHEEQLAAVRAVHDAVLAVASEYPDRVYQKGEGSCLYTPTPGNPDGCLIGAALRRCGYETEGLDNFSGDHPVSNYAGNGAVGVLVLGLAPSEVKAMHPEWVAISERLDLSWFRKVQSRQDDAASWGSSVVVRAWEPKELVDA